MPLEIPFDLEHVATVVVGVLIIIAVFWNCFNESNTIKKENEELQSQLFKSETENEDVKFQLGNAETENENLQFQLDNAERVNKKLQSRLKREKEELQSQICKSKREKEELQFQLDNAQRKEQKLESKLSDAKQEETQLRFCLQKLKEDYKNEVTRNKNSNTQYVCKINCLEIHLQKLAAEKATLNSHLEKKHLSHWLWEDGLHCWKSFDYSTAFQLERAYVEQTATIKRLFDGKQWYKFDLNKMQQKNVITGKLRKIKRVKMSVSGKTSQM
ncbi:uncharacterized protein LOC134182710 [Corticium candelabrum]|uniref:uncharacterized protein LOC134182710 n=1 Tax=Corticium candelabrum TaxID=121492 RepID=UPI002E269264|nr:uncharacterized protein LOC134182710 [Corticium candelabrum]